MRSRLVVILLLCCGLLTAGLGAGGQRASRAEAAEIAPLPSVAADSLVDAYGVGIHLAFLDTPYRDATAVANALDDLGVRHVRDDLFMHNPRQYAGIATVADTGAKFDLIMGNPSSPDSAADYVDTAATQLPPGSVESVEGSNEWDLFSGGDPLWPVNLATRQKELYQAAKANPATADLPVLAPALAFKWNYVAAGDLSQYADYANGHMYPGGYKPSNQVSQITTAIRGSIPDKPLVTTEAGYHNAMNTTNGHLPVPEDVAGVYLPRLLLEHYLHGDKRVYSYELIDEFDDPGKTNPEAHFGLLRRDLSPKPAYSAMKTLLGLLDDPGSAPFTPGSLQVKVAGYPGDAHYVLTQKRNGQFVLLLWRDVSVYDPVTQQRQAVTPTDVTLQLAKTSDITVYRPSEGSGPVTQAQGSSLPLQLDGEVTAITIDPPAAPAPQAVTATSGNRQATVSWQLPQTQAEVSGFAVTRQPGNVHLSASATARSVRDTGLANGATYTYSVRTRSPAGDSAAVRSRSVVPATVPSRPRITRTRPGRGRVTVSWRRAAPQGRAINRYQVLGGHRYRLVSGRATRATLTGLPRGRRLRIGVRAHNARGWGPIVWSHPVKTRR